MNNNNLTEQFESLGLVDSPTANLDVKNTAQYLQNETRPPLENSFPTTRPVAYQPDIQTMTVDYSHPFQQGIRGVNSNTPVESFEQAEARLNAENDEIYRNNRSIYSMPPSSSGGPNLKEEVKPSKEQLETLRLQQTVKSLSERLRALQTEESNTLTRLSRTREALKLIKEDLAELEG